MKLWITCWRSFQCGARNWLKKKKKGSSRSINYDSRTRAWRWLARTCWFTLFRIVRGIYLSCSSQLIGRTTMISKRKRSSSFTPEKRRICPHLASHYKNSASKMRWQTKTGLSSHYSFKWSMTRNIKQMKKDTAASWTSLFSTSASSPSKTFLIISATNSTFKSRSQMDCQY